jgi:uncharacterized protein (DUF2147 family)
MKQALRRLAPFAVLAMLAVQSPLVAVHAAEALVGTWRTIDDQTNRPSSLVAISRQANVYSAKIVKTLEPGAGMKCIACPGDLKDTPVVGLVIFSNVKAAGDNRFAGGKILDPKTGKTYDVQMTLADDGQKLSVLGYVGLPTFGRTVVWERVGP